MRTRQAALVTTRWSVIVWIALAALVSTAAAAQDSRDHRIVMPAVLDFVRDSTEILSTPPFPASPGQLESACLVDAEDSEANLTTETRMLFEHWVSDQLGLSPGYECTAAGTPTGLVDRRGRPAVRVILGVTFPDADSASASFFVDSPATSFGWICTFARGSREPRRCAAAQG